MSKLQIQATITSERKESQQTEKVSLLLNSGADKMTREVESFENTDYSDSGDDYYAEYEAYIEERSLPRQGLKNGKLVEKRGSNQEKFTSARHKGLIKYGKRDVAPEMLNYDIDEEAKSIVRGTVEMYQYFKVINDVIGCGEHSVLIHSTGRIRTDTGKPLEFLIKVYRLQFGLKRIHQWGLQQYQNAHYMRKHMNVPNAYCPTKNVSCINFVGDDGVVAPNLYQVTFEITEKIYDDIVSSMYKLYNDGGMVHGNLSPWTILWWRDKLWYIGFAHAVRTDHPNALHMLMKDCCHITLFFKKKSVLKVKSTMNLFKHITGLDKIDPSVLHTLKHTRKPIKHRLKKTKSQA